MLINFSVTIETGDVENDLDYANMRLICIDTLEGLKDLVEANNLVVYDHRWEVE